MKLKLLANILLGTIIFNNAELTPSTKHHKLRHVISKNGYNKSESQVDSGAKRTWDCHRGCLRFCLPSCKKSCCQPGAKDFSMSMIKEIEEFQGELKGGVEQRNAINEGGEVIEPFACGQFCSPECSPSCTIECCTEKLPKGNSTLQRYSEKANMVQPPKLQNPDNFKTTLVPQPHCGSQCSARCAPTCTDECCSGYRRSKGNSPKVDADALLAAQAVIKPMMFLQPEGTCHIDCEKLCLPACEFVCCVPTKMRNLHFSKDTQMKVGLRKAIP